MAMSQRGHPPDPGIISASHSIASHTVKILDAIETNTRCLSLRANSEILSYKSTYISNHIKLLSQTAPTELLRIWDHIENYEHLIHDILDTVSSDTMTQAETDNLISRLSDFICGFEKTMQDRKTRSPCRSASDSAFTPSLFHNINEMHISRPNFHMNNTQTTDPGLSDHLKQIKYVFIFQTAVFL